MCENPIEFRFDCGGEFDLLSFCIYPVNDLSDQRAGDPAARDLHIGSTAGLGHVFRKFNEPVVIETESYRDNQFRSSAPHGYVAGSVGGARLAGNLLFSVPHLYLGGPDLGDGSHKSQHFV